MYVGVLNVFISFCFHTKRVVSRRVPHYLVSHPLVMSGAYASKYGRSFRAASRPTRRTYADDRNDGKKACAVVNGERT